MACIYSLTFPNGKKYIGFAKKDANKRWNSHHYTAIKGGGKTKLHNAIREYGFENVIKEVLYESDDEHYTLTVMENHYIQLFDSIKNGYNSIEGGGCFPVYYGEDNPGFIRKGKSMSEWFNEEQIKKHKTAMSNRHKGSGNRHARKVKLIDPIGNEYIIHGELVSFCDKNNISFNALFRQLNEKGGGTVGPINKKATRIHYKEKRENTTGWSIFPLD